MANIQWFPGHMAKARRAVAENAKLVDLVLEVVDARLPAASSNPHLLEVVAHKPRVTLLCKPDLADPVRTEAWVRALADEGRLAVAFNALTGKGKREVLAAIEQVYKPVAAALAAKGFRPRPARAMVVGIPNVGKSTVINRLVGGRRAITGNRPGVTRGKQWVRVSANVELLDMPGILMPKIADPRAGLLLAACGAVRDEVFDQIAVAGGLLFELWAYNPAGLQSRFGLTELAEEPLENLLCAGRQRGLLRQGGEVDLDRTAALILKEFREGRLGRYTLEEPAGLSTTGEE